MKRMIPLLVAVAILITAAPAAMADHCQRCKISMDFGCLENLPAGRLICISDGMSCMTMGTCTHPPAAEETLAADFTVASVERIDEPKSAADTALVATLETPASQPANR